MMKQVKIAFKRSSQIMALCLCMSLHTFSQAHAQSQEDWEIQLKMPYSQNYVLLLRQYTAETHTQAKKQAYFELYRLDVSKPKVNNANKNCAEQTKTLIPTLQENFDQHWQKKLDDLGLSEYTPTPLQLDKSLCTDLNQDNQPELFLSMGSSYYFGARHQGHFLYSESTPQLSNLIDPKTHYFQGDQMLLRPGQNKNGWPDLLGVSYAPGYENPKAYLKPFAFSTEEKVYQPGTLTYSDKEKVYDTQNKKPIAADFDTSKIRDMKLFLNRNGNLLGFIHTEAVMYSSFFADALMVVETQTGRVENVFLDDPKKGLVQGLKQRFPQYMKFPGFAQLKPEVLGFNKDALIFKVDISGSCMEMGDTPPCNHHNPHASGSEPLEKRYPQRFAGYWAYSYRTGAFKLISWSPKTRINVEHSGYDIGFQE